MTEREQRCLAQLQPYTPYHGQSFLDRPRGGLHELYNSQRRQYLAQHRPHLLTPTEVKETVMVPMALPQKPVVMPVGGKKAKLSKIIEAACLVTGITTADFLSRRRCRTIVMARRLYCFFAREITGLSYEIIGDKIGLDHSTVLHAIAKLMEGRNLYGNLISAMETIFKDVLEARRQFLVAMAAAREAQEIALSEMELVLDHA